EQDMLDDHRSCWLAELPEGLCKISDYQPKFSRGFPGSFEVDCADLLARGAELFEAGPVERLAVREIGKRPPMRAGPTPEDILASAGSLENQERTGLSEGVAALAACPLLERVRHLDVGLNDLGADHVEILLGSRYLRNLVELSLSSDKVGPRGAQIVA